MQIPSSLLLKLYLFIYMVLASVPAQAELPPHRLVWAQDHGDQRDVFTKGRSLRLMFYDSTADTSRPVLDRLGSFSKPMLTADGQRIVFTDRPANRVYVINTDGSGLRLLASGYGAEVWRDPENRRDFVLVASSPSRGNNLPGYAEIRRVAIDGTTSDLIWNGQPCMINNFQLSADGRVASGQFPWPLGGIADLNRNRWIQLDRGCWSSLCPDNSYIFWIFDGQHRNLYLQDQVTRRKWKIPIGSDARFGGYEVYHPRWSNHPRYFAFTGPYKVGTGSNKITGGGTEVEIFVGEFNANLQKLSAVHPVTSNKHADFFPDLWVEGGEKVVSPFLQRNGLEAGAGAEPATFFAWDTAKSGNKAADGVTPYKLEPRELAYTSRHYERLLAGRGGHAKPRFDSEAFRHACRSSGEFSFEAVFECAETNQLNQARLMTYSKGDGKENFRITQNGNQVEFLLRTSLHPQGVTVPLYVVYPTQHVHVAISYAPGKLNIWLNGEAAADLPYVSGSLASWQPGHFFFGEEFGYGHPWRGTVSHVRIRNSALTDAEVAERIQTVWGLVSQWRALPEVVVTARRVEASSKSDLARIRPYTSALLACAYKLVSVEKGHFTEKEFAAFHWDLLNTRRQSGPELLDAEEQIYLLRLEPFDQHPQFQNELQSEELSDPGLPLYFVVP